MKASASRVTLFVACTLLLCLPRLRLEASPGGDVHCPDVSQRGVLNVMTVNILFSEIESRTARLERIAQFVRSQFDAADPVDVLLLQEAAGGFLVNTENSARDLQTLLKTRYGLDYTLRTAYANGVPGLLEVFNATLSRCAITASLWTLLPPTTEIEFRGQAIPLTRSVLMTRLQVPGVGAVDVYNTHLCANCLSSERLEQAQRLLRFVHHAEALFAGQNPVVLGGDFNTALAPADPNAEALYQLITADSQVPFQDSYAAANGAGNPLSPLWCIRRDDGGVDFPEGCTFGVTPMHDPLGGDQAPARIDYLFVHGMSGIGRSRVVFSPYSANPAEQVGVSDHSAVVTGLHVP
jgi:maltose 6'-phosphate phosphatase